MLPFRRTIIVVLAVCAVAISVAAQTNKAIEAELLRHLSNVEKWSGNGGTRNDSALEKENRLLKQAFLKYGNRGSTLKYDFKALDGKMFIATSKDGKFRIYSWDTETGGTMHLFENMFQYKGYSGRVYSRIFAQSGEFAARGFFTQIFQVDTTGGRVYMANSTFILSNALAHQTLELYGIDGEKLNTNVRIIQTKTGLHGSIGFDYDFFSVVDHPERPIKLISYDEATRSFRFPVVLDDKEFTNGGRVTNRFITYKFNGKYFVKAK